MLIFWIMLFSLLGSVGALVTAFTFLLLREKIKKVLIPCLVSYATGTLLAAALLGLIPQALKNTIHTHVLSTVLAGIVIFFVLEKLMVWRHCHDKKCEIHGMAGPMLLIGDAFHNATDGLVIAASFLSSLTIGITAGISIITHEVAQEVGDFAILIQGGYPRNKAVLLNFLSSLSTLPAALFGYYTLEIVRSAIPYVMAFSAASFLYIALTDLYPQLHQKMGLWPSTQQLLMMLAGIGTMILFLQVRL